MEQEIGNVRVIRQCLNCGHTQEVTSAATNIKTDGTVERYWGSAYEFCNECEGPMNSLSLEYPV